MRGKILECRQDGEFQYWEILQDGIQVHAKGVPDEDAAKQVADEALQPHLSSTTRFQVDSISEIE